MKKHYPFNTSDMLKKIFPSYRASASRIGRRGLPAPRLRGQEAGFTLLLAALIASIVLSLGTSIYTIAVKQVQLSTLGRDSQFAFYSADTGAECALYWDVRYNAFATTTTGVSPTCDGKSVTVSNSGSTFPYSDEFQVDLFVNGDGVTGTSDDLGYCADVRITKNDTNPHTVIHADGYSVNCALIDASARALQRSVELQY